MLVLGFIILLLVVVVFVGVLFGSGHEATLEIWTVQVPMSVSAVFLAGAAAVVLAFLGLWLIAGGARRANKRRRDKKELSRLTKKLERQQAGEPATTAPTQSDEATRQGTASGPAADTATTTGTTATGTTSGATSGTTPARPTPRSPETDTGPVTERDQQKP